MVKYRQKKVKITSTKSTHSSASPQPRKYNKNPMDKWERADHRRKQRRESYHNTKVSKRRKKKKVPLKT